MSARLQTLMTRLEPVLDASARADLLAMAEDVAADPDRIRVHHPAAARVVGRGPLDPTDPSGVRGPTMDDAVRGVLVATLGDALVQDPSRLVDEVTALYRYGDADEKRAVLRALAVLDIGDSAVPLVADALRANDVRLVAAALGAYGGWHLAADAWRQGVLKCLFVGVPLASVARLRERTDAELARLVADYCHERVAAGRGVPRDVWLVLDRHPDVLEETPLRSELASRYADRRSAAERFFDRRDATPTQADESTKEA